ncbi:MAG: glycosyltransferase [Bacteroidota bacterium]
MLKKYSLIVPGWYPVVQLPVSGIFVFKHVQLIAQFTQVEVLYAYIAPEGQKQKFKTAVQSHPTFNETIIYYRESGNRIMNQLLQMYAFWKGFCIIKKKQGLPSVIHNHVVFPAGFFALFISALYRIPLLITEHWTGYSDDDGRYDKLSFVHRFIIRRAFERAKGVSAISMFLKKILIEKELVNEKKIIITGNVLIPTSQLPEQKIKTNRPVKAICVANLDDNQKNISGLIDATAEAVKQFPTFCVTIVGNGPQREWLEQKATELGLLNKNVVFTGNIPNAQVSEYCRMHDFFVLNSNFETFSIATAEAIINGLPVIVTKCGGPEEFVNETNGILVEKGNTWELTQAIKKMIDTFSTYDSKAISKNILTRYSNTEVRESMKELYSLAGRNKNS